MISAADVSWRWPSGVEALRSIHLKIKRGERVLLTGESGSGKSTLLRLLAGLLQRHGHGEFSGVLQVLGEDPAAWSRAEAARRIGIVFQEPGDQLLTGSVAEEIRYTPMNLGVDVDPVPISRAAGLSVPMDASPVALSGGQQQRLITAAVLASGASVLLLDEPFAHLDGPGVVALIEQLDAVARGGCTVLLVEHRLERALEWADRVVVLSRGEVAFDGPRPPLALLQRCGLQLPPLAQVKAAGTLRPVQVRPTRQVGKPLCLSLVEQQRGGRVILPARELTLFEGERVAVVGPNGVGKSTLLSALADAAGVEAVWVPQDPDLSLFCATVEEEINYGPEEQGRSPAVSADSFGLDAFRERYPQTLSKGQRLRVAVAAAAAVGRPILLLDEPTAGQHGSAVVQILQTISQAIPQTTLVFATHDIELSLRFADRILLLPSGEIGCPQGLLRHTFLPPLQQYQARHGWPLVDANQQIHGEEGAFVPVFEPALIPDLVVEVGRSSTREASLGAVVWIITVGLLSILLDRPALLGILAGVSVGILFAQPLPQKTRVRLLLGVIGIVWSTMLSQGLFYGDTPRTELLRVGPIVLWEEGLRWGAVQSLRLLSVGSLGLALALTTSSDRLVALLRAFRFPGGIAFLAATALRTVPQVGIEWGIVRDARARRGRALFARSPWAWLLLEVKMLQPLVLRALRRARRLAESLDSRGFDAQHPPQRSVSWTGADLGAASVGATLVGSVLFLQGVTALYRWEIYYHPSLRPLYGWVRQWL